MKENRVSVPAEIGSHEAAYAVEASVGMKKLLKVVCIIGTLECVLVFLVVYRANCFAQFAIIPVGLILLTLVPLTLMMGFLDWARYRMRAFLPLLLALLFCGLTVGSSVAGKRWSMFMFHRRLPQYEEVLRQIEAGRITGDEKDDAILLSLPRQYGHLGTDVTAVRDANGIASATFWFGFAFPTKHQVFLYNRDGHFGGWHECIPLEKHWALASD
jgi:hypothetical protein